MSGIVNTTGAVSGVIGTVTQTTGTGDVTLTGSQTLTNKTLTAPIFSGIPSGTCSFMVRSGGGTWRDISAGTVVRFDGDSVGDSHDTDSCWDNSAWKFTAPAVGIYLFWLCIYTANTDSDNAFQFFKNASNINSTDDGADLMTHTEGHSGDQIQTATMTINLDASDYITCVAEKTSDYYTGHSSMGGCRIR